MKRKSRDQLIKKPLNFKENDRKKLDNFAYTSSLKWYAEDEQLG